jgi:hypothetical protein
MLFHQRETEKKFKLMKLHLKIHQNNKRKSNINSKSVSLDKRRVEKCNPEIFKSKCQQTKAFAIKASHVKVFESQKQAAKVK